MWESELMMPIYQPKDFELMAEVDGEEPEKAEKGDRRTPKWFFERCVARYGAFICDVAANEQNTLCYHWIGSGSRYAEDALAPETTWSESNWCNPPYGPVGTIPKWIAKAREERDTHGSRTIMLLPADTSTEWFHDVWRTELCELVPYRLKFDAPDGSTKGHSAKFGSMIVIIAPKLEK